MAQTVNLSSFWLIAVGVAVRTFWYNLKIISMALWRIMALISPHINYVFWSALILCSMNGLWKLYSIWSVVIVVFNKSMITKAGIWTWIVIELTLAQIAGAATVVEESKPK